jgi:DNA replication and repair protein RecF
MFIEELTVKSFRNYSNLQISFAPGINFIIGNNGVGKTNILEAISVISNIKSFRNINDSEIIKWNEDSYYCAVTVGNSNDSLFEIGCASAFDTIQKRLKIDGKEIKSAVEYYGRLLTVILSPIDINIINGTPEFRRRFFDSVISKIDVSFFETLGEFRKVLSSRNKLLKNIKNTGRDFNQLDVWDILLCEKAGFIINKRISFVEKFNKLFQNYYSIISEEDAPTISYFCTAESDDSASILKKLTKLRKKDVLFGSSSIGPQRDDFILANKKKIKFTNYASQGQRRTAAVTLKISECEIVEAEKNKKSIILVDDIFSELDEKRRSQIIEVLQRGNQIIFTMVHFDPLQLNKFRNYKGFYIELPGIVRELKI